MDVAIDLTPPPRTPSQALPSAASPADLAPTQSLVIRPLAGRDRAFAAGLHLRELPPGFFGLLGARFLRAYYDSFAASPAAIAFVAEVDLTPAGVLVGTIDTRAHYNWVLRHCGRRLAARGAAALLRRPHVAVHFVRTRAARYLRRLLAGRFALRGDAAAGTTDERVAVLTHVAVAPAQRAQGIGARLVTAFVEAAADGGADRAVLVTVAGDQGAGAFYERLGWRHSGDRVDRDGRRLSEYNLPLATFRSQPDDRPLLPGRSQPLGRGDSRR